MYKNLFKVAAIQNSRLIVLQYKISIIRIERCYNREKNVGDNCVFREIRHDNIVAQNNYKL